MTQAFFARLLGKDYGKEFPEGTPASQCPHCLISLGLEVHTQYVTGVAFSPKGKLVATGSADDSIRLWEAQSGRCQRTLTNHRADVLSLAFNPDGNLLASGGADRKARLWEVPSGRQLHELSASVEGVTSVAFSPDGLRFATGSGDNTARIWTVFPGRSEDYPGQPELSLSARIENYKRQFSRAAIETHHRGRNLRTEPQVPRHIGVNFAGSFNLPPAGSKTSPRRPIPPRSPLAGPDQLDLTASYNVALNW